MISSNAINDTLGRLQKLNFYEKKKLYDSHEILCNRKSDLDLAQSEIMDYVETQPEKKTEENLISLLSKTPIFDPENIIIFDICSFIKTESDAIKALQDRL